MCGRFALHLHRNEVRRVPGHPDLDIDEWVDEDQFYPRYNIAPRTFAPVIRRADTPGEAGPSDGGPGPGPSQPRYVIQSMKWGLVPHWSKIEDKTLSTTNARSENLIEGGGMWGSIKGKKRCAVITEGYYEWLTKGKEKLPHFTKHKDGRVMLMAGLYDCANLEGSETPLWTFTIVTTSASKSMSWLHERQPVILSDDKSVRAWLDTSSQSWTKELSKLVQAYSYEESAPLDCYAVPKEVGKVGTESPSFIEPVSQRKDGIEAMFSKQKQMKKEDICLTSPSKRKHGSDKEKEEDVDDLSERNEDSQPSKRRRGVNADQDALGSLMEKKGSLDEPSLTAVSQSESSDPDPTPSPSKSSPKKKKNMKSPSKKVQSSVEVDSGTKKITSFFGKRT